MIADLEIDAKLLKLKNQLEGAEFEPLETEWLEIKSVPPTKGDWNSISETICAFLNTRGGVIILGVKEGALNGKKRYEITGWRESEENRLKSLSSAFTDYRLESIDVSAELGLLIDQRKPIEIRVVS